MKKRNPSQEDIMLVDCMLRKYRLLLNDERYAAERKARIERLLKNQ